jgi:hypothetical protein
LPPGATVTLFGCVVIVGFTIVTVSVAALEVTLPPLFFTMQRYLFPLRSAVAGTVRVAVLFPVAPEFFQVLLFGSQYCHW